MKIRRKQICIIVNAPEWYKQPDFAGYITRHAIADGGIRVPTYHVGEHVNEYSDIFVNYESPSGSGDFYGSGEFSEDLPENIQTELAKIASSEAPGESVLFWIQNIE